MSEGGTADRLYLEAIERLGRTCMGAELARAHLVYGEWLRRDPRTVEWHPGNVFAKLGISSRKDLR